MSRTIKFRAWDTKNKRWLDEIPPEEYMLDSDNWSAPDYGDMCDALMFYPKSPIGPEFGRRIVYQQLTGLKDKNGGEIYEGDIVRKSSEEPGTYSGYIQGEVFYSVDHCAFMINDEYAPSFLNIPQNNEIIEIIGNIFENSNLLN